MSSANPPPAAAQSITVTAEQADQLEIALALAKALAAPPRLALVGALAAQPDHPQPVEALAAALGLAPSRIERDLRQLEAAGLIQIVEWQAAAPGREPQPAQVTFNPAHTQAMPQIITVLHQLLHQVRPSAPAPIEDERARTLRRFWANGRLLGWPERFKQQVYLLEEIVNAFAPGTRYTEGEVNAILKEMYPSDHCTPRRSLIDLKFLQRDHGIYWRAD